jgi:hypothetical protein
MRKNWEVQRKLCDTSVQSFGVNTKKQKKLESMIEFAQADTLNGHEFSR